MPLIADTALNSDLSFDRQASFEGGVDKLSQPRLLKENQCSDLLNVELDNYGRVSTRQGVVRLPDVFDPQTELLGVVATVTDGQVSTAVPLSYSSSYFGGGYASVGQNHFVRYIPENSTLSNNDNFILRVDQGVNLKITIKLTTGTASVDWGDLTSSVVPAVSTRLTKQYSLTAYAPPSLNFSRWEYTRAISINATYRTLVAYVEGTASTIPKTGWTTYNTLPAGIASISYQVPTPTTVDGMFSVYVPSKNDEALHVFRSGNIYQFSGWNSGWKKIATNSYAAGRVIYQCNLSNYIYYTDGLPTSNLKKYDPSTGVVSAILSSTQNAETSGYTASFAKFVNAGFTFPQLSATAATYDAATKKVTFTTASNHGLSIGQTVVIFGQTGNNVPLNGEFPIAEATLTTFSFFINAVPAGALTVPIKFGEAEAMKTITFLFSSYPPLLTVGQTIAIVGAEDDQEVLNGLWTVASTPTPSTITFRINITPRSLLTNQTVYTNRVKISKVNHGFIAGDKISIDGQKGLNEPLNGTWEVMSTQLTANSFMIELNVCPKEAFVNSDIKITKEIPTAPKGMTNLCVANGRMFASCMIGGEMAADTLLVGDFLSENFDLITNTIRVGGDGGRITSIVPWTGDRLVVFKETGVYVVTGITQKNASSFTISAVDSVVGAINQRSCSRVGADIVFVASDGIRTLSRTLQGSEQAVSISASRPVYSLFDKFVKSEPEKIITAFAENTLFVSGLVADDPTKNRQTIVFDTAIGVWVGEFTGSFYPTAWCMAIDAATLPSWLDAVLPFTLSGRINRKAAFVFGSEAGQVFLWRKGHKYNASDRITYNDDVEDPLDLLQPIQTSYSSRGFTFGEAVSEKIGNTVEIEFEGSKDSMINVRAKYDTEDAEINLVDIDTGDNFLRLPANLPNVISGRAGIPTETVSIIDAPRFREAIVKCSAPSGKMSIKGVTLTGYVQPYNTNFSISN